MADYYYLIDVKQVGKKEDDVPYLLRDGVWVVDNYCVIDDRLLGYDPYEKSFGNSSIMDTVKVISETEIQDYV